MSKTRPARLQQDAQATTVIATQMRTIITKDTGGTKSEVVITASQWTKVRMFLETAGDVAVGTQAGITPPNSGRGVMLPANAWMEFTLAPATTLYIASTSIDRVKFIAEPIPGL